MLALGTCLAHLTLQAEEDCMAEAFGFEANEIDETIPVIPGGTLFIDLQRGTVDVRSHDANEVRIEARATGWAAWSFEFDLTCAENGVRLTGQTFGWGMWPFGGARVTVRAWVPRDYSVDVRTHGGRVQLADLTGRTFAETSGGAVELASAEGPVSLRTSGGPIRAERVHGDLRVETSGGRIGVVDVIGNVHAATSGGSIEIARVTGRIDAHTSGGRVDVREAASHVEVVTSGGPIFASFCGEPSGSLETSGGTIEAWLPGHSRCQLEARTSGGRVIVDEALRIQGKIEPRHVTGAINSGGAPLRLSTSGGSVVVRAVAPESERASSG
jgi:Toastrack DUF4097